MLRLTPAQTRALSALAQRRGLAAIERATATAFPDVAARAGERLPALVAHAAEAAAVHGLYDVLCIARLLACWCAWGVGFESRPEFAWALAILSDHRRHEGVKVFQLCLRVAEELERVPARPGVPSAQPGRPAFEAALAEYDRALGHWGPLGGLVPMPPIRLGAPCDLDAVDLRVIDNAWRQRYERSGGRWQRVTAVPAEDGVLLKAGEPDALPQVLTVLSRSLDAGDPAQLRVRTLARQACDAAVHPWLRINDLQGLQEWRGVAAADVCVPLIAAAAFEPEPPRLTPAIAYEDSAQHLLLRIETCGLRPSGLPLREARTELAIYPADQWLIEWERAPATRRSWPASERSGGDTAVPACRIERDGSARDASAWIAGLQALDTQLLAALEGLVLAWERSSGVQNGQVHAEPTVLAGRSGLGWGWCEDGGRLDVAPFMAGTGFAELSACALQLELEGLLRLGDAPARLRLACAGKAALSAEWTRTDGGKDWAATLAPVNCSFRDSFELALRPLADDSGCLVNQAGPVEGALVGAFGMRPCVGSPGLQWYAQLRIEAVSVLLSVHDPLLGLQTRRCPLLPDLTLLDWSLG
ncbi:MAG: hypothetical protein KGI67_10330 [Pseudomonadota bacterium]|nr:hypothetical protein [Pseudomonadota bacterium]